MPATGGSSSIPNNNASSHEYQNSKIVNLDAKDQQQIVEDEDF